MSIPKMMNAAVVDKFREPLSIREVSVPAPLPGEVLVEIVASGVCIPTSMQLTVIGPLSQQLHSYPGMKGRALWSRLAPVSRI